MDFDSLKPSGHRWSTVGLRNHHPDHSNYDIVITSFLRSNATTSESGNPITFE